jgi:predicted DCC family thiol-disulfide oxidoreductase YuxK
VPPGAPDEPVSIVLFDGVCNLCSRSVAFIIRHDPRGRFHFASLQSEPGRAIVQEHGRNPEDLDSILLLESERLYDRSSAALRIARRLSWPWPLASVLVLAPRPLRDLVYRWIARNRYRWFGKMDAA